MTQTLARMPDELVTAVLAANFDAASLANRLADGGIRADAGCAHLYARASQALRKSQSFDHRITYFLDRMHCWRMLEVMETEPELLRKWACAADWKQCPDFGGMLWALARDDRPEVRGLTRVLVQRLLRHALHEPRPRPRPS